VRRQAAPPGHSLPGHSLPEFLVALTVLAVTIGGISASVLLASRWTEGSVLRQRALSAAEAALDSLAALPDPPLAGSRSAAGFPWLVEWDVEPWEGAGPAAATLRVRVTADVRGAPAVELRGLWSAPPPGPLP
jgi:Tfp pilus assembly protein PilV